MTPDSPLRELVTRRRLLAVAGTAVAAGSLLGRTTAGAATRIVAGRNALWLSRSTFARRTGQRFGARTGRGPSAVLTLVRVGAPAMATVAGRRVARDDSFVLTFRMESGSPLEQGIYELSHPHLGRMDLFVVPTTGRLCAVTVNRSH